jgi:lipopolysaccharide export system permease protein
MNVIQRYIAFATLKSVGLVLLVLVGVMSFLDFAAQLDDVGVASYGLPQALAYVALGIPRTIFDVLPAAALLGALLALGNLAVHRELTVMRASGVSPMGLVAAVGLAGIVLMGIMVLLGESLAPSLGAYAREMRTRALVEDVDLADDQSAWLKQGDRVIHLRRPAGGVGIGGGVQLFELGDDDNLRRVARADSVGVGADNGWILANYSETRFSADGVEVRNEPDTLRPYDLNPELLGLSAVREDYLDTRGLRQYIDYLRANDLDATRYLIAYWTRIANVVSVVFMTLLALPFVFGGLRSAGTGARLMVGLVFGLSYYVVVQLLANSGQVFDLDPLFVAWAPLGALSLITLTAILRMR